MSTTQKLRNFVDEPMGNKPVDSLAGIGHILGKRLREKGYAKAYNVLGKFLYFDKDKDVFVRWLKISINANSEQGTDCFNCLNAWCDNHI